MAVSPRSFRSVTRRSGVPGGRLRIAARNVGTELQQGKNGRHPHRRNTKPASQCSPVLNLTPVEEPLPFLGFLHQMDHARRRKLAFLFSFSFLGEVDDQGGRGVLA